MPSTLITDRGGATAVYETLPYFRINPTEAPVRTTTEVLNDLAAECGHLNWPRLGGLSSRILAPPGW
jgi:hypothetical protein